MFPIGTLIPNELLDSECGFTLDQKGEHHLILSQCKCAVMRCHYDPPSPNENKHEHCRT